MRTFIAGHNGLVGSALLRNAPDTVEIITISRSNLDLSDKLSVLNFLSRERVEAVILAAARVGGIGANSQHQSAFLLDNLKIQNAVIEASVNLEIQHFLFLGSSCIYPQLTKQPMIETSFLTGALEPTNEGYALAKIAGIRLIRALFEEKQMNYFSLIPTNLYGPNDNFDLFSSHVPAALLRRFHEAKIWNLPSVDVWGTGSVKREFMHVDDLANSCWFFLNKGIGGEAINIGTGLDISIKEFAHIIAKIVDYKGKIDFDRSKPDGMARKLLDTSKAKKYGWSSSISLEEGLSKTYEWFVPAWNSNQIRGLK